MANQSLKKFSSTGPTPPSPNLESPPRLLTYKIPPSPPEFISWSSLTVLRRYLHFSFYSFGDWSNTVSFLSSLSLSFCISALIGHWSLLELMKLVLFWMPSMPSVLPESMELSFSCFLRTWTKFALSSFLPSWPPSRWYPSKPKRILHELATSKTTFRC